MKPWIDRPGYIATPPREGSIWVRTSNGGKALTRYTKDRQFWYFVFIGWHIALPGFISNRGSLRPDGLPPHRRFETDPVPTWLVPNPEAWIPQDPTKPRVQRVIEVLGAMPLNITSGDDLTSLGATLTAMDPTFEEAYDLMAWARGLEPNCDYPLDVSQLDPGNKYVATIARLENLMHLRNVRSIA